MKRVYKKTPHVKRVYVRGSGHAMYMGTSQGLPVVSSDHKKIMRLGGRGYEESIEVKKILKA